VKTQSGYREAIAQVIRQQITYTNFIAELSPESVNQGFLNWLNAEVPQQE
jgi:periplasmic divalent cation tolerance protein